ncbi:MAG: hypothetical protein HN417_08030 [Desulfobacula sp.]|jgi:hypothetical protein|nr:hypothetical protein [Desulfobacula sp.]MBT6341401.1 hypothetical protein [Desulfobacula sp.]
MINQNKKFLKMVKPLKSGELLVKEGFINQDDIHKALLLQKKEKDVSSPKKKLFGMILCDLNLITPLDNFYVLHKYNKLQSIQSTLISKNILQKEVVTEAGKDALQQNIPFISFLINTGLVSISQMKILLFELFHIPFKSINNFTYNKKDLNLLIQKLEEKKSWENKTIPLVLKDNTILFGITDPENILFIRTLNDLFPQYRFKTLFIPFSQFSKLHNQLYKSDATIVSTSTIVPVAPIANTKTAPTPSIKKPLDLSLLLNFTTSIKDPEHEFDSIKTLYERYELLRQLIGNPKRADLEDEFTQFIIQAHKKITRKYNNQIIKFSLKKENRNVKIIAFPKT